ncbi:hypothetical protein KF728_17755 [Candidatus Obscuribacterales bacterium]|nr:hypothetical protein [Candidatus Obscuribacterales bacterium]
MDRPYDGQVEQSQMRDIRADKAAGQSLAVEASGLLSGSLAAKVANCEAAGLSFTHLTDRPESQAGRSAMDFLVMGGMLDASRHRGGFSAAFVNSMLDTGGNKVSLDAATGKLLTTDGGGRTIDYDAKLATEQASQRNATVIPALFLGSPFVLIGMGAASSMTDHVQSEQHRGESGRLRAQLGGAAEVANSGVKQGSSAERLVTTPEQAQSATRLDAATVAPRLEPGKLATGSLNFAPPKGYNSDVSKMNSIISEEKKLASSTRDMYTLPGLAPELFPNQHLIEKNSRARDQEKKTAKRIEADKSAVMNRKRSQMRVKLMSDRSSLTVANLSKRKEQLENEIELARGVASLAEVSRMHSELEVLDKAITRLTRLGM